MSASFGSIALITGASSGIGMACARVFAAAGLRLVLLARRKDRLDALAADLKAEHGTDCLTVGLDVRDREAVKAFWDGLADDWKQVDVLINNAGLSRGLEKLHEGSISDWEEMIDTNIKGLLYISRCVIPGMLGRARGSIVNLGSVAGHEVYSGGNVYCATKHAVDALTRSMRIDLVDTPVRVCAVSPGMVDTEFSEVRFHGDRERAAKVYEGMQPLTAEDIADAVFYAVSRPPHVQIAEIQLFPTAQAGATCVSRKG